MVIRPRPCEARTASESCAGTRGEQAPCAPSAHEQGNQANGGGRNWSRTKDDQLNGAAKRCGKGRQTASGVAMRTGMTWSSQSAMVAGASLSSSPAGWSAANAGGCGNSASRAACWETVNPSPAVSIAGALLCEEDTSEKTAVKPLADPACDGRSPTVAASNCSGSRKVNSSNSSRRIVSLSGEMKSTGKSTDLRQPGIIRKCALLPDEAVWPRCSPLLITSGRKLLTKTVNKSVDKRLPGIGHPFTARVSNKLPAIWTGRQAVDNARMSGAGISPA